MSYYIKGDKERGAEVIALLESKGGINKYNYLTGGVSSSWYYISNRDNVIYQAFDDTYLKQLCEELTLSEKWIPKYKVGDRIELMIDGAVGIPGTIYNINYDEQKYDVHTSNGDYSWGEYRTRIAWTPKYNLNDKVDFSNHTGTIIEIDYTNETYRVITDNNGLYWLNEYEIKKHEWTPKRGDRILVKYTVDSVWDEAIYSYTLEGVIHTLGGLCYYYCIPFDESKLGKVTYE